MSPPGSGEEKHVPPAQERASRGPRDFLTILFKHRSKVSLIFLASVLAATIWSFLIPPTYEAKSILMVKIGGEYVNRPEVGDSRALMLLQLEEVVNSEIRILSSRELIEKVLTTLKVETVYPDLATSPPSTMPPLQAAVLAFGKKLTVEGVRKSNVIEVAFRHKDPRVAARAVNLLVDYYKEKHLQVFSDPKSSFPGTQLAVYETNLKESETRMEAFKRKNRVFSPDEQRSLLLKQYQEEKLLLQNTREEIRLVKVSLKEQETGDVTRADLRSLNAKAAAQARRLGTLENEIRSFDRLDKEFQALKREVASNEMKVRTYLERMEEARISEEMNRKKTANVSVIQPAEVPAKPITPNKGWNILLGMILGAVSGLGVAFFSEYASESFSTPGIAGEQLALPVLTTIRHRD
jgi:uncharacterized protein involved in exopolysaccharide biosynthesis